MQTATRSRFLTQLSAATEQSERLRDLAEAGTVELAPIDAKPTALVRSRILEALDGQTGDLQGHVVKVTARGLSLAPTLLCVYFAQRPYCVLHVATEWKDNSSGFEATLVYELSGMPF